MTDDLLSYLADYACLLMPSDRHVIRESVPEALRGAYDKTLEARQGIAADQKLQRDLRDRDEQYRTLKARDAATERLRREKLERQFTSSLTPAALAHLDALRSDLCDGVALEGIPDPDPLVDGWLSLDSLCWLAGPSGTYKSFVAFDLAARYTSKSMDYHGEPMGKGRALYVVAEGATMFKHRKRAWETEHNQLVEVTFLPRAVQLGDIDGAVPAVIELCRSEGYTLIIFDTQAMCTVGQEESDNTDMGVVINALHALRAATGACVLLVHHFGKDSTSGMRGASAIYAAANTVISVRRKDDIVGLSTEAPVGKQKDAIERSDLWLQLKPVTPESGRQSLVPVRDTEYRQEPIVFTPEISQRELIILEALIDTEAVGGLTATHIAKVVEDKSPRNGPKPWAANNAASWLDKLIRNETVSKNGSHYTATELGKEAASDAREG